MSDNPNVYTLTELQYTDPGNGPWKLYIYRKDGYHGGPSWFSKDSTMNPEERTIPLQEAEDREYHATKGGLEVRITDGGDMLVLHSKDGKVVYGADFWKSIL